MTMIVPKADMTEIKNKERRDREKQARADIKRIDEALDSNNKDVLSEVHSYIDCKYQVAIIDWGLGLYGYSPEYGLVVDDSTGVDSLSENLKKMKAKIEAYGEGKNVRNNERSSTINDISVNAISRSRSDVTIDLVLSFNNAKDMISDLTTLTDEQVNELHEKINELESIAESDDKKREKWKRAAPLFQYMIDKGIDVAKIVFPLIMNL